MNVASELRITGNELDLENNLVFKDIKVETVRDIERNFANQQKILEDESARKELLAIAGTRAENVQKYLMKKFSIDEDHLLICSPTVNFEPEGKSTVSFRK